MDLPSALGAAGKYDWIKEDSALADKPMPARTALKSDHIAQDHQYEADTKRNVFGRRGESVTPYNQHNGQKADWEQPRVK